MGGGGEREHQGVCTWDGVVPGVLSIDRFVLCPCVRRWRALKSLMAVWSEMSVWYKMLCHDPKMGSKPGWVKQGCIVLVPKSD